MVRPASRRRSASFVGCVAAAALLACTGPADAISPRRLVEVVDIDLPVVAPAGDQVAFRILRPSIERNTWDSEWYVLRLDEGSLPVRVAEGGVPLRDSAGLPVATAPQWAPDGKWIYYLALIDGRVDVWRAATDGSTAAPVTRDPGDVKEFHILPGGQKLAYSVGAPREEVVAAELEEYERGIRVDETTPTSQSLFRSGYTGGRLATQRLGFWFDRVGLLAHVLDRWHELDLRSGDPRQLAASGIPGSKVALADLPAKVGQPVRFAQDPDTGRIAFLARDSAPNDGEPRQGVRLAVVPGGGKGAAVECLDPACIGESITNVQWRPGRQEVIFTVTDAEKGMAQDILRWDVESGVVSPVVGSGGLLSGGRDERSGCGLSELELVCVVAGPGLPPRLERIDVTTGERSVVFDPNAALARDIAAVGAPRVITWTGGNGTRYSGQYFPVRDTGGQLPPLFVTYYKCPGFQRGGYGDEWPLAAFAAHGIAALCINSAPFRAEAAGRYAAGLAAVESAVDFLAGAGEIDGTRVGMGGLSFGSEVTMWTLIHSDMLSAASITSPLLSSTMYRHGSLKGQEFFTGLDGTWQSGSPDATPAQWDILAPERNLDRIDAPVLMQMPEQEYLWALDYAVPLARKGKADLYAFPHEPHFKFQPRHLLAANERNLDWFRFWLSGEEDSEPAKREQFSVWRSMKEGGPNLANREAGR